MSQFGIDVRLHAKESIRLLLPNSLGHILFSALRLEEYDEHAHPDIMFLKFENVGMGTIPEHLYHGFNWAKSRFDRSAHGAHQHPKRRESDLDKTIARTYSDLISNDDPSSLPSVRIMCLRAMQLLDDGEKAKTAQDFLELVESKYHDGDLKFIRCGNEVILDWQHALGIN